MDHIGDIAKSSCSCAEELCVVKSFLLVEDVGSLFLMLWYLLTPRTKYAGIIITVC